MTLPDIDIATRTLPRLNLSGISVALWEFDVPKLSVPQISVPSDGLPKLNTPDVSVAWVSIATLSLPRHDETVRGS